MRSPAPCWPATCGPSTATVTTALRVRPASSWSPRRCRPCRSAFWGDDDGSRLRAAYFEDHPGVWTHGDWITFRPDGPCTITGRSDATLNRGGVRLGTSDFYAIVEAFTEVDDSLVIHLDGDDDPMGQLLLFVQLHPPAELDDELAGRLRTALRTELSPRHVPDRIVAVPVVPRTLSGKKLEVPVKRILLGADVDAVASPRLAGRPHLARPLRRVRPVAPSPAVVGRPGASGAVRSGPGSCVAVLGPPGRERR